MDAQSAIEKIDARIEELNRVIGDDGQRSEASLDVAKEIADILSELTRDEQRQIIMGMLISHMMLYPEDVTTIMKHLMVHIQTILKQETPLS